MAVIRHVGRPEDYYTMVPNRLALDTKITLQAKGLYLYLRSHQAGSHVSTPRIGEALGINKDTASKYVRELSDAGYLIKIKAKDDLGRFAGFEYVLTNSPIVRTPEVEEVSNE